MSKNKNKKKNKYFKRHPHVNRTGLVVFRSKRLVSVRSLGWDEKKLVDHTSGRSPKEWAEPVDPMVPPMPPY